MRLILVNLFRLILLLVAVVAVRALIGYASRAFTRLGSGRGAAGPAAGAPRPRGELKKDPVCGVFVSTDSALKRTVGGEVIHFCSAACRDKFRQA